MKIRSKSFQNIFTSFPKTTSNNSTTNYFQTKKFNLFKKTISNSFLLSKGSSTFDFMNDTNKNEFNQPKLKPPFLTKSKRNIKIHKNILDNIKHRKKILNSLHKHKLSDSCELFYKLDKAYMTDKNSLRNTNTFKYILKENDDTYDKDDEEEKIPVKNIFRNIFVKNKEKNVIINLKLHSKDKKEIISDEKKNSKDIKEKENNINFIYNKIFPKIFVSHNSDYNVIDNKLNLLYAEDEIHFNHKLNLKNKFLRDSGQKIRKMVIDHQYATDKLNEVKKKIGFIKGITDFSFPDIILQKSKIKFGINNYKKRKLKKFKLPCQIVEEEKKREYLLRAKSLSEAILINGRKNLNKSC